MKILILFIIMCIPMTTLSQQNVTVTTPDEGLETVLIKRTGHIPYLDGEQSLQNAVFRHSPYGVHNNIIIQLRDRGVLPNTGSGEVIRLRTNFHIGPAEMQMAPIDFWYDVEKESIYQVHMRQSETHEVKILTDSPLYKILRYWVYHPSLNAITRSTIIPENVYQISKAE